MKFTPTLIVTILILLMSSAQASEYGGSTETTQSDWHRFGVGLASLSTGAGNETALTGWIPLKQSMGIQPYFAIPATTGSFNFLAGGAFKKTVHGNSSAALHLGADLLFGSLNSNFTMIFGGLFGAHFILAPSMILAIDGGPQLTFSGGNANFSIGAVSSLLGASLIYFF